MLKRKKLITAGASVAFAGLGAWAILRGQGDVQYRTAAVERGTVAYSISATGNLNAVVTVQVGSQVSGNIMALYADFNTRVKKGQTVARIDPQVFQARVDQASANLNAARAAVGNAQATIQKSAAEVSSATAAVADAKANVLKAQATLQNAKINLDRQLQLFSGGIVSRQDRDTAQLNYDSAAAGVDAAKAQQNAAEENVRAAQAQLQVARAQAASAQAQVGQAAAALEQAQVDLNHTYIQAPVDGVVVARQVDVGQTVAASLQAPTLFQIAQDLTKMQVDTNVSEADVGRVQVGQPANFTVDAYPGQVFHGLVTAIRKAPINVQNVVTYDVIVAVDNPDVKLFPGMTANVNILVDRQDNVLKVPNAALRFKPENVRPERTGRAGAARKPVPAQTVWVLGKDGKPRGVPITTGISDGTYTEVTGGGLREGDRVITAAFSKKDDTAKKPQQSFGGRRGPGF